MSPHRHSIPTTSRRLPAELPGRLRSCRAEIEDSLLARMRSIADPAEVGDADYVRGLREAVRAALEHAIEALDRLPRVEEPVPPQLAAQARVAARRGVALEVVIRRYVAGHALLCQFILREAGDASARSLESALRSEAALLDHVVAAVSGAYANELDGGQHGSQQRRAERVRRLLAGEPLELGDLGYDLALWHLGAVAFGANAESLLRELAAALDRRLLVVPCGREEVWAWLGGHRRLTAEEAAERVPAHFSAGVAISIGEPGRGVSAWRLTHRQAKLALPIARRGSKPVVAYSEVALLATALGDEVLADSLTRRYIAPLAAERNGGLTLRETLAAYLAADRNVTSAAAALGVKRHTVTNRLRTVEQRLGRSIDACAPELETALRLHVLGS